MQKKICALILIVVLVVVSLFGANYFISKVEAQTTTLGYNTVGSSGYGGGTISLANYTLSTSGTYNLTISGYFDTRWGESGGIGQYLLYSDNTGQVGSFKAVSNQFSLPISGAQWVTAAVNYSVTLNAGVYWLGYELNQSMHIRYASVSGFYTVYGSGTFPTSPSSFGGYYNGYEFSLYTSLTPCSVSTPTDTSTPTPTPIPTSSSSGSNSLGAGVWYDTTNLTSPYTPFYYSNATIYNDIATIKACNFTYVVLTDHAFMDGSQDSNLSQSISIPFFNACEYYNLSVVLLIQRSGQNFPYNDIVTTSNFTSWWITHLQNMASWFNNSDYSNIIKGIGTDDTTWHWFNLSASLSFTNWTAFTNFFFTNFNIGHPIQFLWEDPCASMGGQWGTNFPTNYSLNNAVDDLTDWGCYDMQPSDGSGTEWVTTFGNYHNENSYILLDDLQGYTNWTIYSAQMKDALSFGMNNIQWWVWRSDVPGYTSNNIVDNLTPQVQANITALNSYFLQETGYFSDNLPSPSPTSTPTPTPVPTPKTPPSTMSQQDWQDYNNWLGQSISNGTLVQIWKNLTGR